MTTLLDETALNALKRLEVQRIAKHHGLATFGQKKDIIARLLGVFPGGVESLKEDIESTHHFRRHDIDQPKAHYNQAVEGGAFVPETSVIGDGISQSVPSWLKTSNNFNTVAESGAMVQPLSSATPLPTLATPPSEQPVPTFFSPFQTATLSRSPTLGGPTTTLRRLPFPIVADYAQGPTGFTGLRKQGYLSAGVPAGAAPRSQSNTGTPQRGTALPNLPPLAPAQTPKPAAFSLPQATMQMDPRCRVQARQGMLHRDPYDARFFMPSLPEGGPSMPSFSPFDEEVAAAWHNQMIGSTASEKHTGSGKDGRKESTVVNQKRKHKKDEDADRAHFWGATRSVGVSGNWDDPDAGVDEEDRRLEALEIEARAIASKQAEAGQSAPENASVKNDARVMKGCTSGEMARIVYSNRERAEKLAQIAQMRLQMAHDIAQLEVGAQRLRRAKLMMLAKRMALQELIDGLRRRAGEDDEDEENADGSDHRGSDNCDDRRKDEKEHGQEDGECSGPIVSPKTQVLQLKGVTRHEAKMILQHMQKSLSEADLEVDGAPKASHSGSTMSGPSTSSRVLHPLAPGLLPAWNETPRGVRKEPSRKSSSGQSSSPGVAASSSRSFSG